MKNYFKKASLLTLVVTLSCLIFTACEKSDDSLVIESDTSVSTKNLYFYGSDAEFEELQGLAMTLITSEEQLEDISKTAGDSYALFVGKNVDIHNGLVDNLRNTGILVTQLDDESLDVKKLNDNEQFPDFVETSNEKTGNVRPYSPAEKQLNENSLSFTTYLSINGEHKILGSSFKSMKEAIPRILEWAEKMEKSKNTNTSKSNSNLEAALSINIIWDGVVDVAIGTEIFHHVNHKFKLDLGSGPRLYPDTFVYNHKITAIPTSTNKTWAVGFVQIHQQPIDFSLFGDRTDMQLRNFSPEQSSNGVLDGRTGSETVGVGGGVDGDGPSISVDWSQSVDWSIPASSISTYHNPTRKLFNVLYRIDPNGGWKDKSVTVKNHATYVTNARTFSEILSYKDMKLNYFIYMEPNKHVKKHLLVYSRANKLYAAKFHSGYFDNRDDHTLKSYSW